MKAITRNATLTSRKSSTDVNTFVCVAASAFPFAGNSESINTKGRTPLIILVCREEKEEQLPSRDRRLACCFGWLNLQACWRGERPEACAVKKRQKFFITEASTGSRLPPLSLTFSLETAPVVCLKSVFSLSDFFFIYIGKMAKNFLISYIIYFFLMINHTLTSCPLHCEGKVKIMIWSTLKKKKNTSLD